MLMHVLVAPTYDGGHRMMLNVKERYGWYARACRYELWKLCGCRKVLKKNKKRIG